MGSTSKVYCLGWTDFSSSLTTTAQCLREDSDLVDVTLSAGGRIFPAHKLVLSSASPLLMELFKSTRCQHPILMLAGISAFDLESILSFIYHGEVNIDPDRLPSLLQAAQYLDIQALSPSALSANCAEEKTVTINDTINISSDDDDEKNDRNLPFVNNELTITVNSCNQKSKKDAYAKKSVNNPHNNKKSHAKKELQSTRNNVKKRKLRYESDNSSDSDMSDQNNPYCGVKQSGRSESNNLELSDDSNDSTDKDIQRERKYICSKLNNNNNNKDDLFKDFTVDFSDIEMPSVSKYTYSNEKGNRMKRRTKRSLCNTDSSNDSRLNKQPRFSSKGAIENKTCNSFDRRYLIKEWEHSTQKAAESETNENSNELMDFLTNYDMSCETGKLKDKTSLKTNREHFFDSSQISSVATQGSRTVEGLRTESDHCSFDGVKNQNQVQSQAQKFNILTEDHNSDTIDSEGKQFITDMPIECSYCGIVIQQSRNLRRHIELAHGKPGKYKTSCVAKHDMDKIEKNIYSAPASISNNLGGTTSTTNSNAVSVPSMFQNLNTSSTSANILPMLNTNNLEQYCSSIPGSVLQSSPVNTSVTNTQEMMIHNQCVFQKQNLNTMPQMSSSVTTDQCRLSAPNSIAQSSTVNSSSVQLNALIENSHNLVSRGGPVFVNKNGTSIINTPSDSNQMLTPDHGRSFSTQLHTNSITTPTYIYRNPSAVSNNTNIASPNQPVLNTCEGSQNCSSVPYSSTANNTGTELNSNANAYISHNQYIYQNPNLNNGPSTSQGSMGQHSPIPHSSISNTKLNPVLVTTNSNACMAQNLYNNQQLMSKCDKNSPSLPVCGSHITGTTPTTSTSVSELGTTLSTNSNMFVKTRNPIMVQNASAGPNSNLMALSSQLLSFPIPFIQSQNTISVTRTANAIPIPCLSFIPNNPISIIAAANPLSIISSNNTVQKVSTSSAENNNMKIIDIAGKDAQKDEVVHTNSKKQQSENKLLSTCFCSN